MLHFRLPKKFLSAVLLLIAFIIGFATKSKPVPTVTRFATGSAQLATVTRVIDGDTIEIGTGQKIRYIGIDAPELHNPRKPAQCFAREAMEENKKLVEGKQVRLEKDVSETDKYARLLRFVYVENPTSTTEAVFVNDFLVRQGFASAATFPPDVQYADQFKLAQREAMKNNRGLWQKCK